MAYCKLDQMAAKDIEENIHIAVFLSTVNDPKQAKAYWEKKTNKATLAVYIRSTVEAEKQMRKVQQPSTKSDKDKPRLTQRRKSRTNL